MRPNEPDGDTLVIYTIYDRPADYPNEWVCRPNWVKDGKVMFSPNLYCRSRRSIEDIRSRLRAMGLVCITRDPSDDPYIVESWL